MTVLPPWRPSSPRRRQPSLGLFAVLALAVHGMGAIFCAWAMSRHRAPSALTTVLLGGPEHDAQVTASREALLQAQKKERKAPKTVSKPPQEAEPPLPKGTVVNVPPSPDDRPPPPGSRFLAQHNAHTQEETRSRNARNDFQNVMNEMTAGKSGAELTPQKDRPQGQSTDSSQRPGKPGSAATTRPQRREQQDRIALSGADSTGRLRNTPGAQARKGEPWRLTLAPQDAPGAGGGQDAREGSSLTMAQLIPSVGALAKLGGGPKNDVPRDVKEGAGTFLNAREFKYASFFNRVHDQLTRHWHPSEEHDRRDPTRNIYGIQDRTTVLTIILDGAGALLNLELTESSGLPHLDEECRRAVRAAAPFVHPPKALQTETGQVVLVMPFTLFFKENEGWVF